jgi:tetratricopeptide (TPR) repeat protein
MINRIFFNFAILALLSFSIFAQSPKPTPKKTVKTAVTKTPKPVVDDKDELKKVLALTDLNEKINALLKFKNDFPNSTELNLALEILVSTRAQLADEKLRAGDTETAIQLFKDAVKDVPEPISDALFAKVVLQLPSNLILQNQPAAALEIARQIEAKVGENGKQLLGLATFYIGAENPKEAKRLAEKTISLVNNLPAAYHTLGIANRLDFDLEAATNAFAKALELDSSALISKRSLAEMKRATGKPEEAVTLYRELIKTDENDTVSNNGLILALFDAGQRAEAENLLNKSLAAESKNLNLLAGAAYWYAAHNEADKAIEFGRKATELEPRYPWGSIALARGQMLKNQPLEAEKTLLFAQQYTSFPTLDYELATARFQAGLIEEAVRELKRRFAVSDGYVQTYVGGRKLLEAESFTELLGVERAASINAPISADTSENSEKMKRLLDFNLKLFKKDATKEELDQAVDEFVKGDDKMKTHRQLYVASRLLETKKNLTKVLELTQAAVKGIDSSLSVPTPTAAVMADELVESRTLARSRGEIIVTPEVPRQTLSYILRGRIEEITGWALYQQDQPQDAIIRLKRAISILPEKSAWWRSSNWKLGVALEAAGNSKEALEAYIKSYNNDQPDKFRRLTVEGVYRKVNGNTDGLDKLIGPNPFEEAVAQVTETPTPTPTVEPSATPAPTIETTPTPVVKSVVKADFSPTPSPSPDSTPIAEITPTPTVQPTPEKSLEIENSTLTPTSQRTIEPAVTPTPEIKTETKPDSKSTPKPLFPPVIIEVGKTTPTPTPTPTENKESETATQNKETTSQNTEKTNEPVGRPRVVTTESSAISEPPSCLVSSQDNLSILSKGGNLLVLVGFLQEGEVSAIKAESSSPSDVTATPQPEIGKQTNRAFFVIKSISETKGVFTVTFTSPCGKKEIQVKVR